MNRIATSLSIAVLLLAGVARAQFNNQKITATIPFEFVVGKSTFPAGQYVFLRSTANRLQIRNLEGQSLITVATTLVQPTGGLPNTKLKFANISGAHVLVQVWNEADGTGSELYNAHTLIEEARYPAIHGSRAGRR